MPGRKSKYSTEVNGQIKVELFSTLAEAGEYDNPTIEWIQNHSIYLKNFTTQKLSRSLNEMVEMGFVRKGKLHSGRMVYRLVGEISPIGQETEDNDE
jgi:hypothetical protein